MCQLTFVIPVKIHSDPDIARWHTGHRQIEMRARYRVALEKSTEQELVSAMDRAIGVQNHVNSLTSKRLDNVEEQVKRVQRDCVKCQVRIINVPKSDDTLEDMVRKVLGGCCKLPEKMVNYIMRRRVELRREGVAKGQAPVVMMQCGSLDDMRLITDGSRLHSRSWVNPWFPGKPDKSVQCVANLTKFDYDQKMCAITLMRKLTLDGVWTRGKVEIVNKCLLKVNGGEPRHYSTYLDLLPSPMALATDSELEQFGHDCQIVKDWVPGKLWDNGKDKSE